MQLFIGVLSRAFMSYRDHHPSHGSSSPDGGTFGLKQSSPSGDQSTGMIPAESVANQRDWSVLMTVLDRVCFTLSVTAVVAALAIFFPR